MDEEPVPVPANHRPLCKEDLILFGGMATLLLITAVISYWITEFRPLIILQVGNLIGAGTMYLRGK